ncbi:MAG TPA: Ig-like domain-containing protein [Anaeromyxobacter sp.]|nr:Ig-like domain-containing protein [Anaeromyxobacter sp.]
MHDRHGTGERRSPAATAKFSRIAISALLLAAGMLLLGRSEDGRRPPARDGLRLGPPGPGAAVGGPPGLDAGPAAGSSPTAARPVARPSFDLGAVMAQVHHAFRRKDGAWRGGHTTYEAALLPDGALEVVPWDRERGEGAAVSFAPSRVARGAGPVAGGAGEARTDAQGRLEISRGALVERLGNGPDGVEQSWDFPERPEGRGDLDVQVALAGGAFVGETDAGLHFSGGKLGVRYGHATWVDALGVETAVPARWDGDAILLRVPASVLDGSVYPAVLDPMISPELSMDAPIVGPAWGEQSFAAVASDGTGWLVVWQDSRPGAVNDIYGARVSAAGAVLDPTGIPISTAAQSESYPAVAWGGTQYLVAWGSTALRGARVSGAGDVLDPGGFTIRGAGGTDPAIAWNGTQFLVAWYDGRNGTNDIFCARVTAEAEVLDPGGVPVSTAAAAQVYPVVAANGGDWLVVWYDYRTSATTNADVYGARVSGAGEVLDPSGIAISAGAGYQTDPAVAWNGANYLVVWSDDRNGSNDIYGARVSPAGAVLDPTGFAISTALNNQREPALAWSGTSYLVVWCDPRTGGLAHIYGARVTGAGEVLDAGGIPISPASSLPSRPAVAWNGSSFLAAWDEYRNAPWKDVYAVRVSGAGAVLDAADVDVSRSANAQQGPAMAWDGTNYLVVWQDWRASYSDIYGARLSGADGSLLDPSGIAVSTATGNQANPAVSWGGSGYLVVWEDERKSSSDGDIYGARVSGAGAVLGPEIAISTLTWDQLRPAVAWNGASWLVVWEESESLTYQDIFGKRVGGTGAVLDAAPISISAGTRNEQDPALACDGTGCLVTWLDYRDATSDIYGARVSGAGALLDPSGFAISNTTSNQFNPAVAWDGTDYLVVWTGYRSGTGYDVYGARVTQGGTLLDPSGIAVSAQPGDQTWPSVAWDGTSFLVAWQDLRSGGQLDIYAAQVTPAGAALDSGGFLVSGSPLDERAPAVVSSGPRRFLVAYSELDGSPGVGTWRVRARSVEFTGPPTAYPQSVTTSEDTAAGVTLVAVDPDGDPLTWTVLSQPSHGSLSGTAPDLTYAPAPDFAGSDAFTFVANDGGADSNSGTVSITVTPVNDAPVAQAQAVTLAEDGSLAITLAATDVDGDALIYSIPTPPAHGALSGSGPSRIYTPAANFHGTDAFTFSASDGTASSAVAVSITVTSVNDAPAAEAQAVTVAEDGSVPVTLAATDADGDPLTYTIATPPAHGTLSGAGASRIYAPAADFHGRDAFSFTASDGALSSGEATVSVTVSPVNDAPIAEAQAVTLDEDGSLAITLVAADVDGDVLTYSVVTPPAHGTLAGAGATRTYTPAADFHGSDGFTFAASDGTVSSGPATASLTISSVNDAPVAGSQSVTVSANGSVAITLAATDVDGDPLTYAVVALPAHGTLSGSAPGLTYAPGDGYGGPDTFTFKANDGSADSAAATVSITVTPPDDPGKSGCGCTSGGDVASLGALLAGLLVFRRRRA